MKSDSLRISAAIPADPKAVYTAWMSSKGHGEMTGSPARVTARVGSLFSAWDGYISGTTLELTPCTRIVQTWRTSDFRDGEPDSRLEILMEPARSGTRVTLIHTHIPAGRRAELRKGWIDFYFTPMKEFFTKRT